MTNDKRLIDANALKMALCTKEGSEALGHSTVKLVRVSAIVDAQHTVDAVEVVHGRWFDPEDDGGGTLWHCNKCHNPVKTFCLPPNYNYCPNCGAKMEGERKDNGNLH